MISPFPGPDDKMDNFLENFFTQNLQNRSPFVFPAFCADCGIFWNKGALKSDTTLSTIFYFFYTVSLI